MPSARPFTAAILAVALFTSACTAWRVDRRPVETIVRENPGRAAFTMNDLRWVVLRNPRLQGDSVIGVRSGGNTYGRGRTALALNGVRAVEKRKFSFIRTVGLGVALALAPAAWRLATVEEE